MLHPEIYESVNQKTKYLHEGIDKVLSQHGIAYQINRYGSMLSVHFTDEACQRF